ncbi:MAG: metal ABC transporter solute-binding protein, Zn/Mn family [Myxococcota bacterium]
MPRSTSRCAATPLWVAAMLLCVLPTGGCGGERSAGAARPLVLVSVAPQRSFVRRLAGDRVDVEVMVPPGANPVLFEPTLGQLRALQEAALYVKVGHPDFPFEQAHLAQLLDEHPELPVADGAAGTALRAGDPHYWLAPGPARAMARSIARALVERFPEHRDEFQANLAALLADIDTLDRELRRTLAGSRGARFFVFHPGWGYFAEAYGLLQVAVEQDHKTPTAHRTAELASAAREAGVRAIFVQPQFDPRAARLLAEEIGARPIVLDPLAEDWFANMARAGRLLAEHSVP